MKKRIVLGAAALLFVLPSLAACHKPGIKEGDTPQISAPIPPISGEEAPEEVPEELPEEKAQTARYLLVCASALNVRSGAGVSYPALGQAEKSALLPYEGTEGGWHRTQYRNRTAYVSAADGYTATAELQAGDARTEAVIAEGFRLLGTPYVYGAARFHDGAGHRLQGFSAEKFDCSSLMQYIFYRGAGVLLNVTTRTQVKQGTHVERANLKRGDLLFFTNAARFDRTGVERVGHVALYLGDNYILHTASDYAKAEPISAARWNYFLEARRVL